MISVPRNSEATSRQSAFVKARVWDLPTRVFHWLLVLTVSSGWILGDNLSFTNIQWHFYAGYATGVLIAFRIFWCFFGNRPARWRALFPSPTAIVSYLSIAHKRQPCGLAGHNPIGAFFILVLLVALGVQVVTGLFSEADDLFSAGPLSTFVSKQTVQAANTIHGTFASILLSLVGLHLLAILYYLVWKRENLILPMLSGWKLVQHKGAKVDSSNSEHSL